MNCFVGMCSSKLVESSILSDLLLFFFGCDIEREDDSDIDSGYSCVMDDGGGHYCWFGCLYPTNSKSRPSTQAMTMILVMELVMEFL